MNWDDKGFLLSKIKYSENSIIAEFFTHDHGKSIGIIFGASSKKIKNYLQIGNLFQINSNSKNETKIGTFKVEIINPHTPFFFNNRKKLHCIISAMSMIKVLSAENQKNEKVYELIINFFNFIKNSDWIKNYILWELELLKLLGYDLDLAKIVSKEIINNQTKYFVKNTKEKKIVPNFLIETNLENINTQELLNGLNLVSSYVEKNILNSNNINMPISRVDFVNLLK